MSVAGRHFSSCVCSGCERAHELANEIIYKRGFEAGRRHQKQADPPPKAKQYRVKLELLLVVASSAVDCVDDETKRDNLRRAISIAEAAL